MGITVTPGLVDVILAGFVLESGILAGYLVRAGSPQWVAPLLLHLASGALLLLALRSALSASGDAWIALALLTSGVVHVASLWQSYRALRGSAGIAR